MVSKLAPRNRFVWHNGRFRSLRLAEPRRDRRVRDLALTAVIVLLILALSLVRSWHFIHGGVR